MLCHSLTEREACPKSVCGFLSGIIALKVSQLLWHSIARLNNVKLFLSPLALRLSGRTVPISFWSWVVDHPEVPLILTEGAKKAAALLSLGYVAIALTGIFNGYRQPKDEFGRYTGLAKLIPQLQVFATPGLDQLPAINRLGFKAQTEIAAFS